MALLSEAFPHDALEPVAGYRQGQGFLGNRKSKPGAGLIAAAVLEGGETRAATPTTAGKNPLEVSRLQQSGGTRKPGNRSVFPCRLRRLRAEASAALGTTAGNHLAATDGCHAGTKAMCTLAAQRVGLIGAFHVRAQQGKRARSLAV